MSKASYANTGKVFLALFLKARWLVTPMPLPGPCLFRIPPFPLLNTSPSSLPFQSPSLLTKLQAIVESPSGEVDSSKVRWEPYLPAPDFQQRDLDITNINMMIPARKWTTWERCPGGCNTIEWTQTVRATALDIGSATEPGRSHCASLLLGSKLFFLL